MESLNDDTVMRIFSYLDLKSQQAIITVDPRFYNLMSFVWSAQYKTVNMSLYEADFSIPHLDHFFESIRNTVKVIRLRLMTINEFKVITSKVYPKVYDFRFGTDTNNQLCDADVPKMIKSFPNLTTFSPQGNFTGLYFSDFPLLERITLTHCKRFFIGYVANIMTVHNLKEIKLCMSDERFYQTINLKLSPEWVKSLESIKIDFEELTWFQDHLKDLKNLKELTICGYREHLTLKSLLKKMGCLTEKRYFKILETCNSTDTLDTVVGVGARVDALKIVTDNYLLQDLGRFSVQFFTHINQLYFKDCVVEEKPSLDSLMLNIANVDFISFEQCLFSFGKYMFEVSQIVQRRYKPLRINLFENLCEDKTDWDWSTDAESHLFQIDQGQNYKYTYETIYMKF